MGADDPRVRELSDRRRCLKTRFDDFLRRILLLSWILAAIPIVEFDEQLSVRKELGQRWFEERPYDLVRRYSPVVAGTFVGPVVRRVSHDANNTAVLGDNRAAAGARASDRRIVEVPDIRHV
jgi:hypothetical protein